jgi:hypothetical protein
MTLARHNQSWDQWGTYIDVGTKDTKSANTYPTSPAVSYSAQVVSFEESVRRSELRSLQRVISKSVGLQSMFAPNAVDSQTAAYGLLLLSLLAPANPLPKVAVDGEGGLCLVWDRARTVLVTLIQDTIHLTVDPGEPTVANIDDIKIRGRAIPPELAAALQNA